MARKVFISFLGATNYGACHYCIGEFDSGELRFFQEAILDYLCQSGTWTKKDVAYILTTEESWRTNWLADGQRDKTKRVIKQPGLNKRLRSRQFPMTIKPVKGLPNGDTEEEVMNIFQRVFDLLREGDELYFDITHGFRYLPMLIVVLGNYSKFLKNVRVKMISYGNYDGRDRKTQRARIMDLTVLSTLQDWASGAAALTRHGDARAIRDIVEQQGASDNEEALSDLVNNLVAVTAEIQTCRGTSILNATNISEMMTSLRKLQTTTPKPLSPIIEKISASFSQYSTEFDVNNGWLAAQWALKHNLLQQAATILQENAVSYFCVRNGIAGKKVFDVHQRDFINAAVFIATKKLPQSEWKYQSEKGIERINLLLKDKTLTSDAFLSTFNQLTEIRNDLNHFGMRKKSKQWDEIQHVIEQAYATFINILN